jgi:hypothetical protein
MLTNLKDEITIVASGQFFVDLMSKAAAVFAALIACRDGKLSSVIG